MNADAHRRRQRWLQSRVRDLVVDAMRWKHHIARLPHIMRMHPLLLCSYWHPVLLPSLLYKYGELHCTRWEWRKFAFLIVPSRFLRGVGGRGERKGGDIVEGEEEGESCCRHQIQSCDFYWSAFGSLCAIPHTEILTHCCSIRCQFFLCWKTEPKDGEAYKLVIKYSTNIAVWLM